MIKKERNKMNAPRIIWLLFLILLLPGAGALYGDFLIYGFELLFEGLSNLGSHFSSSSGLVTFYTGDPPLGPHPEPPAAQNPPPPPNPVPAPSLPEIARTECLKRFFRESYKIVAEFLKNWWNNGDGP